MPSACRVPTVHSKRARNNYEMDTAMPDAGTEFDTASEHEMDTAMRDAETEMPERAMRDADTDMKTCQREPCPICRLSSVVFLLHELTHPLKPA